MIPSINAVGSFTFEAPYTNITNSSQQYKVISVRGISELQATGEDPLNTIYLAVGETEATFLNDLNTDIPIITFTTDGGDFLYVPANKILSDAKSDGIRYVEKTILVNIGYLPEITDTSVAVQSITDIVYNSLGVTPAMSITPTSSVVYVSETKHNTLDTVRSGRITAKKSYKTMYENLLTLYNNQQVLIQNIEQVYRNNGIGG